MSFHKICTSNSGLEHHNIHAMNIKDIINKCVKFIFSTVIRERDQLEIQCWLLMTRIELNVSCDTWLEIEM